MEKDNLEILLEDIRSKFDLVLEGHDVLHKEIIDTREELCEKINLVDFKVETLNKKIDSVEASLKEEIQQVDRKIDRVEEGLNKKIDSVERSLTQEIKAVAADLAAHRADTESHQKGYKVSDGK